MKNLQTGGGVPDLASVLAALDDTLRLAPGALLDAYRERDALRGQPVAWAGGQGRARGVDHAGRLVVERTDGTRTALAAGEVHLVSAKP